MIVKSQNGDSIINFVTTRMFYISRRGKNYGITSDPGGDAGEYSTREAAKTILNQILEAYVRGEKVIELPSYF